MIPGSLRLILEDDMLIRIVRMDPKPELHEGICDRSQVSSRILVSPIQIPAGSNRVCVLGILVEADRRDSH